MYPVSAAFAAEVKGSYHRALAVELWLGSAKVRDLKVLDGSVSIDARRAILRTCTLTIAPDPDDLEAVWADIAVPGAEIKIWRGIHLISGVTELVPLGVFVFDEPDRASNETISVTGSDRATRIVRARLLDPYVIPAGTALEDAIADLLVDRWSACPTSMPVTGVSLGAQAVIEAGPSSDPWRDAVAIAEAYGYVPYFDGEGTATMRQIPDPTTTQPVATYDRTVDRVIVSEQQRISFSKTYSGVVARGEGSAVAVPVQGVAWDEDPQSPTYYLGPFGQVPYFYSSPLLTTQAEADLAAASLLPRVVGRSKRVVWSWICNPAHDATDVVAFTTGGTGEERHVLDELTIPLVAAVGMTATARETRQRS